MEPIDQWMNKWMWLFLAIVGATLVVFPAPWKRVFVSFTYPEAQSRFWQSSSLWLFRFMGLVVVGFAAYIKHHK